MTTRADGAINEAIDQLTRAKDALTATVNHALNGISRDSGTGAQSAAALCDEARVQLTQASRATRRAVSRHPIETALMVGVVGFAAGWIVKHVYSQSAGNTAQTNIEKAPRTTRRARPQSGT